MFPLSALFPAALNLDSFFKSERLLPENSKKILWLLGILFTFFLYENPSRALAEVELIGNQGKLIKSDKSPITLTTSSYLRTDFVMLNNLIDLDTKLKKDKLSYVGMEYFFDFKILYKEKAELFLKWQRTGPFYDDMPILGRRSVPTIYGNIDRYRNKQFLPELKEVHTDIQLFDPYSLNAKTGLFAAEVGNGFSGTGYYPNYGVSIYHPGEKLQWTFHYNKPDWNNRKILGPIIEQEKRLGRGFQDAVADYFSLDGTFKWELFQERSLKLPGGSIQPYITFLSDRTGSGKRASLFNVQTSQDLLGTLGTDINLEMGRVSVGFEAARNFGQANVMNPSDETEDALHAEDIRHQGYFFYGDASLNLHEVWLTPRVKFMFFSGNKLDRSDGGLIEGSVNRAFSNYSPLNTNLFDSIYQNHAYAPMAAAGNGWGASEGIFRPGTFGDPYLFENLIAPNVGFDFTPFKRVTFSFDWWYLFAHESGFGTWEGEIRKLSRDLGHELDFGITFKLTEHAELAFNAGYFIPGRYYRARRDDTGTTFSPLIRGDGDADNGFQGEFNLTFTL